LSVLSFVNDFQYANLSRCVVSGTAHFVELLLRIMQARKCQFVEFE